MTPTRSLGLTGQWHLSALTLALALPACSGGAAGSASAPSNDAPTSGTASAPATATDGPGAAAAPTGWTDDTPKGIANAGKGALGYVVLRDGAVVAVHSYGSDSEPFVVYHGKSGKLTKAAAPWTCAAGPAEIEASGADAWVHCIDPGAPENKPANHFFHSADGGATWSRVGGVDGTIVMGRYAFGGGALFVSGSFEKKAAALLAIRTGKDGRPEVTAASGTLALAPDANVQMAAADDGSAIAILAQMDTKAGPVLAVAASLDGGKTVRELWRGPSLGKLSIQPPAVADGTLTALVEDGHDHIAGVLTGPLAAGAPRVQPFPKPAEDACVHGAHVAAHFEGRDWKVSADRGATFSAIPAPADTAKDEMPPTLSCSAEGIRSGSRFMAWPAR